ncbi:MAG: hypothetical protein RL291_1100 [Pseudomonadota bacterium]
MGCADKPAYARRIRCGGAVVADENDSDARFLRSEFEAARRRQVRGRIRFHQHGGQGIAAYAFKACAPDVDILFQVRNGQVVRRTPEG